MLRIVALVVAMLSVGVAARLTERNWTAPAVFFSLLWAFYVMTTTYFLSDAEVMVAGVLWIALACASVYLGTLFGHLATPRPLIPRKAPQGLHLPFLRFISAAAVLAGLTQLTYMFARQGFSASSVLSYAAIGQLTAMNRGEFIYGDQQVTLAEQIGLLCLYFGALAGGLLFKFAGNRREQLLGILSLVFATIVPALYGSRMGLLYGGSFWVAAYIAGRVLQHGTEGDGKFFVHIGLVAATLLLGVQVAVQVVRYSTQRDPVPLLRMIADPFGFLGAFGVWFDRSGWVSSGFTAGARTFKKLLAPIGISAPLVPSIDLGFASSNIYTVFRDLIDDFGTLGALAVLFVYGYWARVAFVRVRAGAERWIGILTLILAFILTSFTEGIFYYTATTIAALVFAVYCFVFAHSNYEAVGSASQLQSGGQSARETRPHRILNLE